MAEYLQEGSPVLDSLLVFVNELGQTLSKRAEEKYDHDLYSQSLHIRKLNEHIDDLKQEICVKDDLIASMNDKLIHAKKNVSTSVYTTRQGDKAVLLHHSKPKYGGDLRPGTITHEHVQRQFNEFFAKHRRSYGSKLVTVTQPTERKMYSVPCIILKLAFECCKDFLLRYLTTTILQRPMDKSFKNVVDKLCECAKRKHQNEVIFMDSRLVVMKELESIFTISHEEVIDCWEEKKSIFSMLLNCSDIENKKAEILAQTKSQITQRLKNEPGYDENMIDEGIAIAFLIVTLVPPIIIYHPPRYNEDWAEPKTNYWNSDKACHGSQVTIYFRPALFYSSNGGIGSKSEVGNKPQLGKGDHSSKVSSSQPHSSSRPPDQNPPPHNVGSMLFPLPPNPSID